MFVWKRGRRAVAVLAVLALTMAVLAGCGQKQGAQQPGAQAPGAPAPKAPVTFVFGRGADSDRIDPARTTSGESANVTVNIFDTLVEYQDETSDIQAGLAEKWEPSSDGKVWTFNLRKGVVFHDGTPLNAEAVKFNFDRQMDKKSPYHTNDMEYADFSLDMVEKVEAVDEYTVKFTLKYPFGPFLRNIAMFSNGIVSPEAVKKYGEESFKHPVGTGPFKFESWNKDSEIVLVKNDKYWREGPYVDRLVFKVIPDNNVRLAELEAGSIQAMDGVDPNYVDKIKSNPNLVLYSKPGLNINYMMFPTDVAPWNNKKLN
ncbi:MAG: ABC transporter substrate-binding protein, partial [Actinobacteria bacterium]|nr:ABC transporter substrate-binding protein [Actinomycetota bacterium]